MKVIVSIFSLMFITFAIYHIINSCDKSKKDIPSSQRLDWFKVDWDNENIFLDVKTDKPWKAEIKWSEIEKVCLKMEPDDYLGVSNGLYIWVKNREHSYAIPFDAKNGWELVKELPVRNKFSNEVLIEAMGSIEGVFCWPEEKL